MRKDNREIDAVIEAGLPGEQSAFRFVVEAKSRPTPEAVQTAVAQARAAVRQNEWPMIQVPYLAGSPQLPHEIGCKRRGSLWKWCGHHSRSVYAWFTRDNLMNIATRGR